MYNPNDREDEERSNSGYGFCCAEDYDDDNDEEFIPTRQDDINFIGEL